MLKEVSLSEKISNKDFKVKRKKLQSEMFNLQKHIWGENIPLVIVLEGFETAGKGTAISSLVESLDPRHYRVIPIFKATREEKQIPFLYRFWLDTPSRGEIYIFDHSWYHQLLKGKISNKKRKQLIREINEFERTLSDNKTNILKFWFHLSKTEQKKRLTKMAKSKQDKWRIKKEDWKENKNYNELLTSAEDLIAQTNTTWAPWEIIPCENKNFGQVKVLESILSFTENVLGEEFRKKALEFIEESMIYEQGKAR